MSADKWLTALQKGMHPVPAPQSERTGDPLTNVLLDTAFGNSDIDNVAIIEKATGILGSDPYVTSLDPVGELIEKTQHDKALNAPRSRTVWRGLPVAESGDLVIETSLAEIIGARPEDLAPIEK